MPLPTRPNAATAGPARTAALDSARAVPGRSQPGDRSGPGSRRGGRRGKSQSDACSRAARAWSLASHGKPADMDVKTAQKQLAACRKLKHGGGLTADVAAKVDAAHATADARLGGKAAALAKVRRKRKGPRADRLDRLAKRAEARHEKLKAAGAKFGDKKYESALDRAIALKRAAHAEEAARQVGQERLTAKVKGDREKRAAEGKGRPDKPARGPAAESAIETAARMKAELDRKGGYNKLSPKGKAKYARILNEASDEAVAKFKADAAAAAKGGTRSKVVDAGHWDDYDRKYADRAGRDRAAAKARGEDPDAGRGATADAVKLAKEAARDMRAIRQQAERLADAAEKAGDRGVAKSATRAAEKAGTATEAALEAAQQARSKAAGRGTPERQAKVDRAKAKRARRAERRVKAKADAAPPKSDDSASRTDHLPGHVGPLETASISFDPRRFQYKIGAAESTGSVDSLRGVKNWDAHRAGVVQVWKDPGDGKTYVINGHNRLAKAKQLGVDKVNVMFIDARNAKEARSIGALTNISEGRGTSLDAAKFMRELGIKGKEDFDRHDLPVRESVAMEGIALAALPKHVFDRVVQGEMPAGRAAVIGASGLSHDRQNELVKLYDKFKGNVGPAKLEAWVNNAKAADSKVGKAQSLFGDDEEETSNFLHRSDLDEHVMKQLREEKNAFGAVSKAKRAELLAKAGNQINVEESGALGDTARENLQIYKDLNNTSVFSRLKNEYADKLGAAKGRKERQKVMGDYYDAILKQAHTAYTL